MANKKCEHEWNHIGVVMKQDVINEIYEIFKCGKCGDAMLSELNWIKTKRVGQ